MEQATKEKPASTDKFKPVEKSHITVVEHVYFQPFGSSPTGISPRYMRWLESDEQPYGRRLKVSEEWQPLDKGWMEEAALLVLENLLPQYATIPEPEQRREDESRVVEIGAVQTSDSLSPAVAPFAEVRPGESCRFCPVALVNLRVRCVNGQATCNLHLYPR